MELDDRDKYVEGLGSWMTSWCKDGGTGEVPPAQTGYHWTSAKGVRLWKEEHDIA